MRLAVDDVDVRRPSLVLETNLPDETEVIFEVADEVWFSGDPEKPNDGYVAQSKVTVTEGRARSGAFGYRGGAFPKGKYEASVMMPDIGVQPEGVRAVLGGHGEKMKGPFVKHDRRMGLVTAETKIKFSL